MEDTFISRFASQSKSSDLPEMRSYTLQLREKVAVGVNGNFTICNISTEFYCYIITDWQQQELSFSTDNVQSTMLFTISYYLEVFVYYISVDILGYYG